MLFKIDYTKRNSRSSHSEYVDFAADRTEAVKKFMDGFFANNPGDAVKLDKITEIEILGDVKDFDVLGV